MEAPRPVHVLYLIDSLVPSGAERSLAALAPAYSARGVRLDVAYLKDRPGIQEELVGHGAELFCLEGPGGRLGRVRRARALIADRRPDLVHTTLIESDLVGRFAARRTGVPVVTSLVNPQYGPEHLRHPGFPTWKVRVGWAVDRATSRWVARFHAITGFIADVMGRTLGIAPDRIDVIPRGRDPDALGARTGRRRTEARRTLGFGEGEHMVLAVARQDRQKGLDVLLRALPAIRAEAPGTRLVLVGRGGNHTDTLRGLVSELGLEPAVRFAGLRDDVPDLLCGADAFVLPSRWEGLGSVLLEAMALEAPVVASDIPPIREVVDESTALLVAPERPRELAAALVRSLSDPAGAGRRAEAARDRFLERYTIDRVADRMVDFYRTALGAAA